MVVTQIVPLDKRRSKIILDDDFTLVLYRGEIKRYQIEVEKQLSEETYQEILQEILLKRARERVLFLLKSSDKTELELRRKLKEGYYPEEAADYAIDFLKKHHFIDDQNYGHRYVECYLERKSQRQIQYELQKKGLDKEVIQELLRENPVNEEAQIRAYVRKKSQNPEEMDFKERSRIMAALGRKGFSYETISLVLSGFLGSD